MGRTGWIHTHKGHVPPLYRELPRVLESFLYLDVKVPWSGFSREEFRHYLD